MRKSTFVQMLYDTKKFSKRESMDWYVGQIKGLRSPRAIVKQQTTLSKTIITPGSMYLFEYDPKYKDVLPVYDRFPLVFPYARAPGGFIGFNLHYLHPVYRANLLDRIEDIMNNTKYDRTTKVNLSWKFIKQSSKHRFFEPCIHRYLNNHVRSSFQLIPPKEWELALFLPLERFVTK